MKDFKDLHITGMTDEQVQRIAGGGSCTTSEMLTIMADFRQSYDTLVDFTSYVIERVANSTGG